MEEPMRCSAKLLETLGITYSFTLILPLVQLWLIGTAVSFDSYRPAGRGPGVNFDCSRKIFGKTSRNSPLDKTWTVKRAHTPGSRAPVCLQSPIIVRGTKVRPTLSHPIS
jgi:hypothetical protein